MTKLDPGLQNVVVLLSVINRQKMSETIFGETWIITEPKLSKGHSQ